MSLHVRFFLVFSEKKLFRPSPEDVLHYAEQSLGMRPQHDATDRQLMWIAVEAMQQKLPPEWRACEDPTKGVYYFNVVTREVSPTHPIDAHYASLFQIEKRKAKQAQQEVLQAQGSLVPTPPSSSPSGRRMRAFRPPAPFPLGEKGTHSSGSRTARTTPAPRGVVARGKGGTATCRPASGWIDTVRTRKSPKDGPASQVYEEQGRASGSLIRPPRLTSERFNYKFERTIMPSNGHEATLKPVREAVIEHEQHGTSQGCSSATSVRAPQGQHDNRRVSWGGETASAGEDTEPSAGFGMWHGLCDGEEAFWHLMSSGAHHEAERRGIPKLPQLTPRNTVATQGTVAPRSNGAPRSRRRGLPDEQWNPKRIRFPTGHDDKGWHKMFRIHVERMESLDSKVQMAQQKWIAKVDQEDAALQRILELVIRTVSQLESSPWKGDVQEPSEHWQQQSVLQMRQRMGSYAIALQKTLQAASKV